MFNADRHHRQSIRLQGHDYSRGGAYYVTICTHQRECIFGQITEALMHLNMYGEIVQEEWQQTAAVRANVRLDVFVVMPNHIHGIIVVTESECHPEAQQTQTEEYRHPNGPVSGSLGAMIGQFKSAVTRRINSIRDTPGTPVWQRNYHERIIRDDRMMNNARRYIVNNPARWQEDVENPANASTP